MSSGAVTMTSTSDEEEESALAANGDLGGAGTGYGGVACGREVAPDDEEEEEEEEEGGDEGDADAAQDGVRRIEAVSMVWTKWGLAFAYFGILLMSFTTSLEGQVTYSLSAFAVSSFKNHSLISAVYVVQGIVNAVIKPPMAKVADVFGRLEAFSVSIVLYVIGYVQMAASRDVQTYASAQVFYSAGATGLQILQQIFIADTSDLRNRALFSSLPDSPFLVTVWIGSSMASAILAAASWRWGYGVWAVVLPVAFLPLALSLSLNSRKAKRMGLIADKKKKKKKKTTRAHQRQSPNPETIPTTSHLVRSAKKLCMDLDVVGMLLLSAAFALILLPLTLAETIPTGWQNGSVITMMALGLVFLVAFPLWESQPTLAPFPLVPLTLLRSRAFCAGCGIGFFYFMVFYLSIQPYFYSYLLVVHDQSVSAAGRITQTFSFAATVTNLVGSLLIRRAGRYKAVLVTGSLVYLTGALLLLARVRAALPSLSSSTPPPPPASIITIAAAQAVLGAGASLLHLPAQLAVQAAAGAHQQVAAATAVFMTLVSVGGACGAAISGAVWSALLPRKLVAYLPTDARPDARKIYASVAAARSYGWGTPARMAVNQAYAETVVALLRVAVVVCLPVVLLGLLVEDRGLDDVDQHVRGRVIGGEVGPTVSWFGKRREGGREVVRREGGFWKRRWRRAHERDGEGEGEEGEGSGLLGAGPI